MSKARRNRVPRPSDVDVGGLITPHEMFERPLPRPFLLDFDLPFEERVERAWARLKAGFEEDEYERLLRALVEVIEDDRRGVMPAKGGET